MNRKKLSSIIFSILFLSTGAYAIDLQPLPNTASSAQVTLDRDTIYYPNANIKSAIAKYKKGNYSGCLQELFSLTKKDPSNAMAYYYMAMAFTHVDMKDDAIAAYEKVISLSSNGYLVEYATKGRDCLTDGPACQSEEKKLEEQDDLDRFINSPYGNGFSPELNEQIKQKELKNIQETINRSKDLKPNDIQKIKDFDDKNSQSSIEENDKIAQVSDEEVLKAVKTLKEAGVNVTIGAENPYSYQDPQMAQMSLMLGNYNNNNSNMIPMLMASQEGKNIDPRLMQAMIMNSMMTDLNSNNNNRY